MDVNQAKLAQYELANAIAELINNFQQTTLMQVERVEITPIWAIGGGHVAPSVTIRTSLTSNSDIYGSHKD